MNTTIYSDTHSFQTYHSNASEKQILVDTLSQKISMLDSCESLLDIGSHDGQLLKRVLSKNSIQSRIKKVIAVEPADVKTVFLNNIHPIVSNTTFFNQTIDSYFQKQIAPVDIILASQCLYWSKNLTNIIAKIANNSKASLIVLRGKKGIYTIQSNLRELIGNDDEMFYTSDVIKDSLNTNNITYANTQYETTIHMPHINTLAWYSMMSFFLQRDLNELSRVEINNASEFINEQMNEDKTALEHHVDFFWLGNFI
jgi:hypothetical protein